VGWLCHDLSPSDRVHDLLDDAAVLLHLLHNLCRTSHRQAWMIGFLPASRAQGLRPQLVCA
jgi:hypothetical protein